ncbi:MAG: lysoplasmalogenase [Lachnospiraceae bacterium]|nr:lysoplasmalogenase [Lachnospiraceae bacterium]
MTELFLAVFLISTAIHLYGSLKQDRRLRNLTKPFLLAALFGFYYFTAERVLPEILLALFFSWLGDILLMPAGVKWFTAGGISFMISHGFFIAGYCKDIVFSSLSSVVIVPLALLFTGLTIFIFSKLKAFLPKALFYPMFLYLLINGTMNCFAILRMISMPGAAALVTCIGAVLFFISDSTLFFVRFKKNGKLKTHFWVMLTYSIGELLIIIGLL